MAHSLTRSPHLPIPPAAHPHHAAGAQPATLDRAGASPPPVVVEIPGIARFSQPGPRIRGGQLNRGPDPSRGRPPGPRIRPGRIIAILALFAILTTRSVRGFKGRCRGIDL